MILILNKNKTIILEEIFMKKFVCSVCGYVHTAEELAADFRCPVCKVPASKFIEQKGEMKLAAEHEYGVYGKTVKNNPTFPRKIRSTSSSS